MSWYARTLSLRSYDLSLNGEDRIVTVRESEVFQFADIEVRAGEFLVLKGGKPLSVEPKAFRVLLLLQRNHGRLVKKEALLDAVWEDLNVTENSLTKSIATLRRLLGDDAREPKFIVTVHTEGYRFVCPVEAVAGEPGPEPKSDESGERVKVDQSLH